MHWSHTSRAGGTGNQQWRSGNNGADQRCASRYSFELETYHQYGEKHAFSFCGVQLQGRDWWLWRVAEEIVDDFRTTTDTLIVCLTLIDWVWDSSKVSREILCLLGIVLWSYILHGDVTQPVEPNHLVYFRRKSDRLVRFGHGKLLTMLLKQRAK